MPAQNIITILATKPPRKTILFDKLMPFHICCKIRKKINKSIKNLLTKLRTDEN